MRGEELVFLAWSDLAGVTRGRAVPVTELDERMERGLGWPMARQALTPFAVFAANPWGPAGEVRMIPDSTGQVRINLWDDQSPFNLILCDGLNPDRTPWEACTRNFLRAALRELEEKAGLRFLAAFDLDFDLVGSDLPPARPFTLEAFRGVPEFSALTVRALREAGAEPEMFGPGYGAGQYAARCRPVPGLAAGDRGVVNREVIREVARGMGARASFAPIGNPDHPEPDGPGSDRPGNGARIQFSLYREALPVCFDPTRPGGLSAVAGQFVAGVLRHMRAICAVTAAGVVSYFGPRSQHRSLGYSCCAFANPNAAVRICQGSSEVPLQAARQFHLEYQPSDATANPYLALGVIVRAGLQGIRENLPPPPLVEQDPDEIEETERQRLGAHPLPQSLAEALDRLEGDATVRSWFPAGLWEAYIAVKRKEVEILEGASPQEICDRYRSAY